MSIRSLARTALIAIYLIGVTAVAASADSWLLQSRDIFALETASDPQISPDGKRIVYVRRSYDVMTDKPRANLWIVNTDGSGQRPLRSDTNNHSSPRWSHDGTRLAFISDAEGKPQLFVRWMDTGQTALLTDLTESPRDLTWSPDGKSLAFTQLVAADKPSLAKAPDKPEGANWAPPVTVIDQVVYRVDGQGYLKSGYSHVFVVSSDGGAPRQLTSGNFNHEGTLAFTPDGKRLLLSANRRDDWQLNPVDSDIHVIDLASGAMTQLTKRDGPDTNPVVAPN
ncbi:MAG: PD40 domain-containing protein, partial [Pseudomonadales bacterium]|nr:PD40 domain-containing protein [Pseudomonadales bacterium]